MSKQFPKASDVFEGIVSERFEKLVDSLEFRGQSGGFSAVEKTQRGECWTFAEAVAKALSARGLPARATILWFETSDQDEIDEREADGFHNPSFGVLHAYVSVLWTDFDAGGPVDADSLKDESSRESFWTAEVGYSSSWGIVYGKDDSEFASADTLYSPDWKEAFERFFR